MTTEKELLINKVQPWTRVTKLLQTKVSTAVRGQVWRDVFLPVRTPVWALVGEHLLDNGPRTDQDGISLIASRASLLERL